jgi:hypothetical protein
VTAFFLALAGHVPLYAAMVLLAGIGYWLAVRPSALAWYDPWAAQQVLSAFASAAVLFMWSVDIIDGQTAAYHVAAIAGFCGVAAWVFRWLLAKELPGPEVDPDALIDLRHPLFLLFSVSQLLAWVLSGIPLLLESRLDAFAAGDGSGLLSRLVAFSSIATLFLTVLAMGLSPERRIRLGDLAVVGAVTVASVLSGSKSNIVFVALYLLTSDLLCRRLFPTRYRPLQVPRRAVWVGVAAVGLLMLVPLLRESEPAGDEAFGGPVGALAARLVLSGDGYIWSYGDRYVDEMGVSSPTTLLFSDVLGMFRLVRWEALPVHPGLALYRELMPGSESVKGPNIRVDLFGLLYGSMALGLAFSCAVGAAFGAARSTVFHARTAPGILTGVFLFMSVPALLVDPALGVTVLVNAAIGFGVAWGLVRLLAAPGGRDGPAPEPPPAAEPHLAPGAGSAP